MLGDSLGRHHLLRRRFSKRGQTSGRLLLLRAFQPDALRLGVNRASQLIAACNVTKAQVIA